MHSSQQSASSAPTEPDLTWWHIGTSLLLSRRLLIGAAFAGAVLGLSVAFFAKRSYVARAVFLPQAAEGTGLGGLAAAASQFGIRVANTGGAWGPLVYVEVLKSRSIMEQLARDTVIVPEKGPDRVPVVDLLQARGATQEIRIAAAVAKLRSALDIHDLKQVSAVEIRAVSQWPSFSKYMVDRILRALNDFNVRIRQSQATAERQFVEARAAEAQRMLRASEDRLLRFLLDNRTTNAPELAFERDRLSRDVSLRQAVYSSLTQNVEDARIREVRDTPVITVIEEPLAPRIPEPRRVLALLALGLLLGSAAGVTFVVSRARFNKARSLPSEESERFLNALREIDWRMWRTFRR